MAKKANEITNHVKAVHRELGYAHFVAYHNDATANNQLRVFQRAIDSGKTDWLGTGASIAAQDIYSQDRCVVAYTGVDVRGKDFVELLKESNGLTQTAALVAAYEAMENYLKAVTAEYLYVRRGQISLEKKDKQRLKNLFGKKTEQENTKPWFKQFVSVLARRNCEPLLKLLFKHVKGFENRIRGFATGDLDAIHRGVEFIRHLTTHANGRYDQAQAQKLPAKVQKVLAGCVKKSFLHGGERWLLPDHATVANLMAREAEYAQLIYDLLTNELAMKLDYAPGRNPAEVKSR